MHEFQFPQETASSVKWAPWVEGEMLVATSANFGLLGGGGVHMLGITNRQGIRPFKSYSFQTPQYDVAWCEDRAAVFVAAGGDGAISLFDLTANLETPTMKFQEHGRDSCSVAWNTVSKANFCSSSWDGTVKVWSPTREVSINTLPIRHVTYSAQWNPHSDGIISAVSSDGMIRVWDLRSAPSARNHLAMTLPIHGPQSLPSPELEPLSHDWNPLRQNVLAVAGVDKIIRVFDLRQTTAPTHVMGNHQYAVRKVAWSPRLPDTLASASFDMTCRIWRVGYPDNPAIPASSFPPMTRHSEFVTGIDWCRHGNPGWVASTGWDRRVCVWDSKSL